MKKTVHKTDGQAAVAVQRFVRHQRSQNTTRDNSSDGLPSHAPYEVLLRHHYKTVSELLERAERQDVSEWADWSESKRIFLPVLLSLWKQLGRPEIKWPIMLHLPALDLCHCVLESYWRGIVLMSNNESTAILRSNIVVFS